MPKLGAESRRQRDTCDPRLIRIIDAAILLADFRVLEGHRGKARQHAAFLAGNSQLDWPNGRHNKTPSRAFDFSPWPEDWADKAAQLARFTFIAGIMWTLARQQGVAIRFGWDWNRNLDPRDETFLDWGHVELDEP